MSNNLSHYFVSPAELPEQESFSEIISQRPNGLIGSSSEGAER
jgi:hypothetical protein